VGGNGSVFGCGPGLWHGSPNPIVKNNSALKWLLTNQPLQMSLINKGGVVTHLALQVGMTFHCAAEYPEGA
jgi:hypothetical protein